MHVVPENNPEILTKFGELLKIADLSLIADKDFLHYASQSI